MQSQLEQTKAKMKESNHKIDKQSKEIERLRNKLLDVKQENVEKLFMSMGSHKFNCDAISERNDVDPDVKKVNQLLFTLRNRIFARLETLSYSLLKVFLL